MTNKELLKEIALLPDEAKRSVEDFVVYIRERYAEFAKKPVKRKKPLREEAFFGMWADREDIKDSVDWVRSLRRTQWKR
jgi:hypothetical protein